MISTIRKRDGKLVSYDNYKIANAIFKAAEAVGGKDFGLALNLAKQVEDAINKKFHPNSIPAVEEIQDIVEKYSSIAVMRAWQRPLSSTGSSTAGPAARATYF